MSSLTIRSNSPILPRLTTTRAGNKWTPTKCTGSSPRQRRRRQCMIKRSRRTRRDTTRSQPATIQHSRTTRSHLSMIQPAGNSNGMHTNRPRRPDSLVLTTLSLLVKPPALRRIDPVERHFQPMKRATGTSIGGTTWSAAMMPWPDLGTERSDISDIFLTSEPALVGHS